MLVVEELPTQTAERKRPLGAGGCMNKYVPFRQNHESTVVHNQDGMRGIFRTDFLIAKPKRK